MSGNLFGFFRGAMPADRTRPFAHLPADSTTLSYADVEAMTARLATRLVALGIRPGDRIAVHADKGMTSLLLYLASLRAGAVYLPLNPAYVPAELRHFLADAEPALLVCRPEDEEVLRPLATELGVPRVLTLTANGGGTLCAGVESLPNEFADVPRTGDDLAAILYTSGTTGRAKGAMLSHANLRSNAEVLRDSWRFTASDRLIHALPIFHTHGLFVATNVTLASGASMLFLPRFDAGEVLRLLPEATVLMGVPTFYTRLLGEAGLDRAAAAGMRLFISGSAPLSAETHRAFAERTGHAILERYGMTETNMNTSNPYDGDRVPGSVGLPLPGVELRIADPATGAPLADGPGSIEVRGPNVFGGYWRLPEKTAEEFRDDGFFVTGDLGYRDERGYLHIAGRAKDLIISGGFNIYPAEVEAALDEVPGIAESAVIGAPHPDLGEGVVAVVVRGADVGPTEAEVEAALSGRLARFKQPRRILFTDALPRNAMGKVQKAELRRQHTGLFTRD